MYGSLVIAYLFFGGAAAGALFVISAWSITLRCAGMSPRMAEAFHALRVRAYAIGLVLLILAMVCLLWDLERPERALLLFLRPHPTAITFGAYTLAIECLIAALLFTTYCLGRPAWGQRMLTVIEVICCLGALSTMTYTGVFLLQSAIPLWQSWSLVGLFICSSFSTGLSVVLLIDWFTQGQTLILRAAKPLQIIHLTCLALEVVFLALFIQAAVSNADACTSLDLLTAPDMLSYALVGVIGMGIITPAVMETYSLTRTECRTIPVSDTVCLVGGLCLRYCVIACAAH